jgi:hypothetical protein
LFSLSAATAKKILVSAATAEIFPDFSKKILCFSKLFYIEKGEMTSENQFGSK